MTQLIKQWGNGGELTIAYNGDGDGSAVISSTPNEGGERSAEIVFIDASGTIRVTRNIRQAAAEVVTDTYTRLAYIECDGQQYIDLGYVVKEDDVVECRYILTKVSNTDKFLFGTNDGTYGYWYDIYNNTAYVRSGNKSAPSISNASKDYHVKLYKDKVIIGGTTTELTYEQMPESPLFLFAGRKTDGTPYSRGYYKCFYLKITDNKGDVMHLVPAKRDSDGVVGMLDTVSGSFFPSLEEPFIAGNEMRISGDYEPIEYVTFAKDRLYNLGLVESTYQIEVMYKRSETSATPYLYGCLTSPHTATVSAYLSSGGSWRWGSTYKGISTNVTDEFRVTIKNGSLVYNNTSTTFSKSSAFTTPDTVVLGGYRAASGSVYKNFQGRVFYFRITEGSNYIIDYVPCKRISDGVEGFWDCVTNTFIEPI